MCVGHDVRNNGYDNRNQELFSVAYAQNSEQAQTIKGVVQNQDLRRVPQAIIEVKSQDGEIVSSAVSNSAGEFKIVVPNRGTYSVSAACRRPTGASTSC